MNARLEELRSKFQENPRRYFAPYANELRKAGDVAQAILVCRAHIATQPGHVSGHIVLGQALYEAGEAHEARDTFTAALELDPENLIALRTLGEIAQVSGEFGAARQWYERLLDADPRNSDVVLLLRDLPAAADAAKTEAQQAAPAEAHASETTLAEHSVDIRQPLPPKFHTSFTGAVPAYDPEATRAPVNDEPAADFVETESARYEEFMVEPEPDHEPVSAAAAETETTEPLDVVDLDAFATVMSPPESAADVAPPDESHRAGNSNEVTYFDDMGFDLPAADSAAASTDHRQEAEPTTEVEAQRIEVDAPEAEDLTTASASDEQPRALFAERGFDGPADNQIGWMTTPSAQESDPEAAPENWFDEPAAPVVEDVREVAAESPADEQPVAESSDYSTDAWFDDPATTPTAAASEESDEFWLPPDLSHVAAAAEGVPEGAAEFAEPASAPSADAAEASTAAVDPDQRNQIEPDRTEVEAIVAPPVEAASGAHLVEAASESPHVGAGSVDDHQGAEDDHVEVAAESDRAEGSLASTWSEPFAAPHVEAQGRTEEVTSVDAPVDENTFVASEAAAVAPTYAEPVVGHTPAFDETVPPVTQAPFVTETLAELYLQQGFRDEALAIYRQLAERNPSDQSLRLRIEAIEQGSVTELAQAAPGSAASQTASQSVRTFFARFARRAAVTARQNSAQAAENAGTPEVPFASAASALANLFAASKPPASDEGAASTLASAFTDPAGRPSRAADRELSLDHLFRDVPPGGSPRAGVSLDEFYSTPNASAGSPTEPGEAGESAESGGTDIRQFTAWLEGLRKK